MKPKINSTCFGSITIDGNTYEHYVIINTEREILKRKKISEAIYGTSHTISEEEARFILKGHPRKLII